ncbi:MAG: copper homeostasis protein [Gammaproteobacteria bacterium]|nr:copper homeostasis protein [Gammaproteobacteria bacterium]
MKPVRTCLEVCVESVAGLDIAAASGADRIELCSALTVGGLTPSCGLMAVAASQELPCFVLIRPRAGDFCYDSRDIDVMRRDIDNARSLRLAGVVIGASRADGSLDEETLRRLLEHAVGLPAVLHRAIDLVPDFQKALETAISLGFKRVLTSGGATSAPAGSQVIRKLLEQAGNRIEVMAGAGLNPANVAQFVRDTGVRAVHSSCSSSVKNSDGPMVALGFVSPLQRTTDAKVVTAMIESLNQFTG